MFANVPFRTRTVGSKIISEINNGRYTLRSLMLSLTAVISFLFTDVGFMLTEKD